MIKGKTSSLLYQVYQKKPDQNLNLNILRYEQRVTFKLCNLVDFYITKSLANFLKSRITPTDTE